MYYKEALKTIVEDTLGILALFGIKGRYYIVGIELRVNCKKNTDILAKSCGY